MATVRISQRLYDEIIDNTKRLFSNRRKQAHANNSKAWGNMIADKLYPPTVLESIKKLGKGWIKTNNAVVFEGFYNTPDELTKTNYGLRYDEVLPQPFPIPDDYEITDQYGWQLRSTYSGACNVKLDATNPKWATLYKEYEDYASKLQEIDQEQNSTVDMVSKVLQNYSTLAPCIKVLPKIYDLLPQEARDRHNEVSSRSNRATPEELDIDTSKLDVAMVKDKITKGGNNE